MAKNGQKWPKWLKMAKIGPKWSIIGQKWSEMTTIGQKSVEN